MATEELRIKIKYQPHPAQLQIHNSNARFKVLCCGRRFGKTLFATNEAAKLICSNGEKTKSTRGWIVAPTYTLTRELERYFRDVFAPLIATESKSERRFELITGDEIEFRSADSANLVGAGLDWLIIDEAALIADEVWQRCLRPTLTDRQGKAIIISTPRGRNWFYDCFNRGNDPEYPDYQSWQYASSSNPYLPPSELAAAQKELPELLWRQEYLAEFLDDANSFFRNIDSAIVRGEEIETIIEHVFDCEKCGHRWKPKQLYDGLSFCPLCRTETSVPAEPTASYYIGVDLGQSIDFTVITVVRYHPKKDRLRVVEIDRFNHIDWGTQKQRIITMYEKYKGLVVMDQTGLGNPIVEDLQVAGIPVTGIVFTNTLKLSIHSNLSVKFDRNLIEIPDYKPLINELKSFQAERTAAGNWKLGAPEGQHDDCVTSLALAVWKAPLMD